MKIFISYARNDSEDLARKIHENLELHSHAVFLDIVSLKLGEDWSYKIDECITNCDIFLIIVTFTSLKSIQVERELKLARNLNKIIVPCFHKAVGENDKKWDLNRIHGIIFDTVYDLLRDLPAKISLFEQPNQAGPGLITQAIINYIEVNHNVIHNSINGMNIKTNIKTYNFRGKPGKLVVNFYFANNTPLKGYNQYTGKLEGQLWIGRDLNTQNGDINYRDAILFMPYYSLNLSSGVIHDLFITVSIWDFSKYEPILISSALGPFFQVSG